MPKFAYNADTRFGENQSYQLIPTVNHDSEWQFGSHGIWGQLRDLGFLRKQGLKISHHVHPSQQHKCNVQWTKVEKA